MPSVFGRGSPWTFGDAVYVVDMEPTLAVEDFARYLVKYPGVFIFVGMGGEESVYPHHHPSFDIDEDVIPSAIELFIQLVLRFG
ncbi:M20/M25/M40 family metallo-hydrolase [uncultured Brevibacillus sp.]|uniref:M20/M25/M40 family metallo-hydrolase n=1 Tax=uncultured Brevibacillus sp. TaxID=169970 RepID=UPI0025955685|nr:M20/M25/M40 family metallo-hydrolase [uncultured Brevibacillus sp.]